MDYNVLSDNKKELLKKEYKLRLLGVALVISSVLSFFTFTILLPSFISVISKEKLLLKEKESLEKLTKTVDTTIVTTELAFAKDVVHNLEGGGGLPSTSALFQKVLSVKPGDIEISSLTYDITSPKRTILVTGVAKTRGSLLSYQDALKKTDPFESVDLPVSLLAKDINVSFTLTIGGKF